MARSTTGPGGITMDSNIGVMPIELVNSMVAKARDVDWMPPTTPPPRPKIFGGGSVSGGGAYSDANLASLFSSLNQISAQRSRVGGGTGGGTQSFEGNMDTNALIALNPYMDKNVTSFDQGGNYSVSVKDQIEFYKKHVGKANPNPYNTEDPYNNRLSRSVLSRNTYDQGGAMHQMPDGSMMAGATHPQGYNQGGMYEQAANQAVAENQLSGLVANLMNRRMPMANYGMKRKYQEGGNYPHNMYHPETGYKIVAENESAHNKLNAAGFGHAPKAAYGMKKRYTQGGRF